MSAQMLPFRKPAPPQAKPVDQAAVAFQPDAVMIEERRFPWPARSVRLRCRKLEIGLADTVGGKPRPPAESRRAVLTSGAAVELCGLHRISIPRTSCLIGIRIIVKHCFFR